MAAALSKPCWVSKPQDRRIDTQYFRLSEHSEMYLAVGVHLGVFAASVRGFKAKFECVPGDPPIKVTYIATQNGCPIRDTELVALLNYAPEITRCVGGPGVKPNTSLILKAAAERAKISDGGVVRQQLTPTVAGPGAAEIKSNEDTPAAALYETWVTLLDKTAALAGAARYPSGNGDDYVVALERAPDSKYPKSVCLTRAEWLGLQALLPLGIQYSQYVTMMCERWGLASEGLTATTVANTTIDREQWSAVRCQAHLLFCLWQVLANQLAYRPNMIDAQLVSFASQIQHGDVFQLITAGRPDGQNFRYADMFDRCNSLMATGAFQGEALIAWFRAQTDDVVRDVRTAIHTGEGDLNVMMTGKSVTIKKPRVNKRKQQTAAEVAEEMMVGSGDDGDVLANDGAGALDDPPSE